MTTPDEKAPEPVPIVPQPRNCPACGVEISLAWGVGTKAFHKAGLCVESIDPDAEVDL